ncbi:Hypothetical_protein [Hexamita inflata]|uniref:Hypothetical_protein n=1 Tax=Hexamita inflata TaxID=28002 RepID=A0AA86TT93_9EUKA|nr:Hypothetical protein HINF_LOCUS13607 [Hexamita inflata]CAI9926006.1 Hypothetical protein HINF_LOCUS13651 [Hexamita inflata]CAI9933927.1 Hypothetical protein HINF_LOCUS21572 [Hexamita inflata]
MSRQLQRSLILTQNKLLSQLIAVKPCDFDFTELFQLSPVEWISKFGYDETVWSNLTLKLQSSHYVYLFYDYIQLHIQDPDVKQILYMFFSKSNVQHDNFLQPLFTYYLAYFKELRPSEEFGLFCHLLINAMVDGFQFLNLEAFTNILSTHLSEHRDLIRSARSRLCACPATWRTALKIKCSRQ